MKLDTGIFHVSSCNSYVCSAQKLEEACGVLLKVSSICVPEHAGIAGRSYGGLSNSAMCTQVHISGQVASAPGQSHQR